MSPFDFVMVFRDGDVPLGHRITIRDKANRAVIVVADIEAIDRYPSGQPMSARVQGFASGDFTAVLVP